MRNKRSLYSLLVVLFLCLGLGYAALTTNLSINGTAHVDNATWNVYWDNVQVTSGSVTAPTPTISNQTTLSYEITLSQPGDFFEFTVDAVNDGSMDAMIESINSTINGAAITSLPNYLNYEVTYSDGTALQTKQELLHNTTETYKVRIEYNTDVNANDLPSTDQTLNLQFSVTYVQRTENAIEVEHGVTIYTSNLYDYNEPGNNLIWIGQAIPSGITQYSNAADALTAYRTLTYYDNIQFYLKHTVQNEVVTKSNVEFIVTPEIANENSGMTAGTYALRGAGASYDPDDGIYNNDSPYYAKNKATLLRAFGNSNCIESSSDISCVAPGLLAYAYKNGYVMTGASELIACAINSDGSSSCDYYNGD